MLVRHILQDKGREIFAIAPSANLGEAARLMAQKRIGALLVHEAHGKLAGIISERDLVRALSAEGATALDRAVQDFMTPRVATCTEADTVEEVMEQMTLGRFRHVPVLDGKGAVCGLVSIGDVVKTRIAETVSEASSLREYISATA